MNSSTKNFVSVSLIIKYFLFPFYFLIVLPVEYGLWRAYSKQNILKKTLFQFVWRRM